MFLEAASVAGEANASSFANFFARHMHPRVSPRGGGGAKGESTSCRRSRKALLSRPARDCEYLVYVRWLDSVRGGVNPRMRGEMAAERSPAVPSYFSDAEGAGRSQLACRGPRHRGPDARGHASQSEGRTVVFVSVVQVQRAHEQDKPI
jgi:hypothetical protein